MKNNRKRLFLIMISLFVAVIIVISVNHQTVYADPEADDPMIVVSMGDSYSSGEGIEPFYGQDNSPYKYKTGRNDWVAHRSVKSWPSKLVIPGYEGESGSNTMGDYKYGLDAYPNKDAHTLQSLLNNCEFYFVAASGAITDNINSKEQEKTIRQSGVNDHKKFNRSLPIQLDVFNRINGTVDFVTLTIGGNDIDFANIIATCATKSTYLGSHRLEKDIKKLWDNFGTTKNKIKQTYKDIAKAAPEANIIVADYPQLLDPSGKGFVISKKEAEIVNKNVSLFNDELEKIVNECREEGIKIYFVDVEDKFHGHEAYSDVPWINKIILGHEKEELDDKAVKSSYSVHPNEKGAEAYAECVNEMIRKISVPEGAYAAYLEIVEKCIDEYGEPRYDEDQNGGWPHFTGLSFLKLIDFNEDGIEELIVVYFDKTKMYHYGQIWGYDGKKPVLLQENDILKRMNFGEVYLDLSTNQFGTFLVSGYLGDGHQSMVYSGYFDSEWTNKTFSMHQQYNEATQKTEPLYFIDEKQVDEEKYKEESASWLSEEHDIYMLTNAPEEKDKIEKVINDNLEFLRENGRQ